MFEQPTATFDQRHRGFFNASDEPRQVWALDSATGEIVYLPEHAVGDSVRDACRTGRLNCPIADCADPRLVAKGGTERRHHFAHKVAHTRHDSAAVFRTEAVALLAAWAQRYRGAQISTRHDGTLGIVAIRSSATGKVAELAVTYNPREDPSRMPAGRQLLVGHTRALLLPRVEHPQLPGAWCCGAPRLVTDLIDQHGAAIAAHPERRRVGTVMRTISAERIGLIPQNTTTHPTICLIDHIDDCRLDAHGTVTTPALRTLRAWEQLHGPASRPRPPRPKRAPHARSTPAASPRDVDELPPALGVHPRSRHTDINRVVLSGRVGHDREHWVLAPEARDGTPRSQIVVALPRDWKAPPNNHSAIVLGRLTTTEHDSRLTIVADAVETYERPAAGPLDGG